jgi:hypothetical protein
MDDLLEIKDVIVGVQEQLAENYKENQTILQILVQKNITTPEEVATIRKKVENNSKTFKDMKNILNTARASVEMQKHDLALYKKSMVYRDSLTPTEKEELQTIMKDKYRSGLLFKNAGLLK